MANEVHLAISLQDLPDTGKDTDQPEPEPDNPSSVPPTAQKQDMVSVRVLPEFNTGYSRVVAVYYGNSPIVFHDSGGSLRSQGGRVSANFLGEQSDKYVTQQEDVNISFGRGSLTYPRFVQVIGSGDDRKTNIVTKEYFISSLSEVSYARRTVKYSPWFKFFFVQHVSLTTIAPRQIDVNRVPSGDVVSCVFSSGSAYQEFSFTTAATETLGTLRTVPVYVRQYATNAVIPNASVFLNGVNKGLTNSDGLLILNDVPVGDATITLEASGYINTADDPDLGQYYIRID